MTAVSSVCDADGAHVVRAVLASIPAAHDRNRVEAHEVYDRSELWFERRAAELALLSVLP